LENQTHNKKTSSRFEWKCASQIKNERRKKTINNIR